MLTSSDLYSESVYSHKTQNVIPQNQVVNITFELFSSHKKLASSAPSRAPSPRQRGSTELTKCDGGCKEGIWRTLELNKNISPSLLVAWGKEAIIITETKTLKIRGNWIHYIDSRCSQFRFCVFLWGRWLPVMNNYTKLCKIV